MKIKRDAACLVYHHKEKTSFCVSGTMDSDFGNVYHEGTLVWLTLRFLCSGGFLCWEVLKVEAVMWVNAVDYHEVIRLRPKFFLDDG